MLWWVFSPWNTDLTMLFWLTSFQDSSLLRSSSSEFTVGFQNSHSPSPPSLCCGQNTQHEIHSLRKFLSVEHSVVNYRHCVVPQISRTYSSHRTNFMPIGLQLRICLTPRKMVNHLSTLWFYEFTYFRYLLKGESCNICPPMAGFIFLQHYL